MPFKLNQPQKKLYGVIKQIYDKGAPVRVIILKARQMGFSTLTEALIFHKTAVRENEQSLIIAHTSEATANIFKMSKLFYDTLPESLKPMKKASNARELIFENPSPNDNERARNPGLRSRLKVATAGGRAVERGATYGNIHISEFAFWPGDKAATLNSIMQTVPASAGTMVIIESTANGFDFFRAEWERAVRGESDFVPVFFAWHEMTEYRMRYDGFELTEDEKLLKERYELDNEQIAWRRWCIANNCGGDIKKFNQEYPSCPDDAFVSTGDCVFDTESIILRRNMNIKPQKRGMFEYKRGSEGLFDIRFIESEKGYISVYAPPQKGLPYVIGGDTAGDGSDFFAAQVLDNTTGRQVAVLHHRLDEDFFAEQLYCLGKYYNDALIGVETNFSTHPERVLEELCYPELYTREIFDTYTGGTKKAYGFRTDTRSRPVIISELKEAMRDDCEKICDHATLGEALTFCYNDRHRPEALPGEHDDLIMALAIANHLRRFAESVRKEIRNPKKSEWTSDMYEDYKNAGTEMRARLIEMWGEP